MPAQLNRLGQRIIGLHVQQAQRPGLAADRQVAPIGAIGHCAGRLLGPNQRLPADLGQPGSQRVDRGGRDQISGLTAQVQRLGRQQQAALRVAVERQLRLCGQRAYARLALALLGQVGLAARLGCVGFGGGLLAARLGRVGFGGGLLLIGDGALLLGDALLAQRLGLALPRLPQKHKRRDHRQDRHAGRAG